MPPLLGQIPTEASNAYKHLIASGTAAFPSTSNSNASTNQQSLATATVYTSAAGSAQWIPQATVGLPSNQIIRGSSRKPRARTIWKFETTFDRPLHLPPPGNNYVSANLPVPPNWNENIERTTNISQPYKLFPVDSKSQEFRILEKLLDPLHVCYIDQIANPTLWTDFVNERNGMLKKKCSDPMVLKELSLSDEQIAKRQQSINFLRHSAVDGASFDDNFALLFHCTKDLANVEKIQQYGLDERLSRGGTLGRGIYFTDSSRKAIHYDHSNIGVLFICGVLLGDCIKDCENRETFGSPTKPEKLPAEQRYIDDFSFESIAGQRLLNEFAVYNRNQCYPMYKVVYSKLQSKFGSTSLSNIPPLPPFVWQNEFRQSANSTWAFHARTVFEEMKGMEVPK